MKIFYWVIILSVAISGCGKKKEKIDILTELEKKPAVTEVKSVEEAKPETPEAPTVATAGDVPVKVSAAPMPEEEKSEDSLEVVAQKVETSPQTGTSSSTTQVTTPTLAPTVPRIPQVPQIPRPVYTPPPRPQTYVPQLPPAPPKPYKPPGLMESTGELIGHLVNPTKRKEEEKQYSGW